MVDPLTHIFLPLALIYGAGLNRAGSSVILLLSFFAILPDFDVFLGVHRGLFHSLLFVLPLLLLSLRFARSYSGYISLFLFSHLALDFLTGGVPFLYPLVNLGVGVEFPLVIKFGSAPEVVEWLPRLVFSTPARVHGQAYDMVSSFGIATLALFLIIYLRRRRG